MRAPHLCNGAGQSLQGDLIAYRVLAQLYEARPTRLKQACQLSERELSQAPATRRYQWTDTLLAAKRNRLALMSLRRGTRAAFHEASKWRIYPTAAAPVAPTALNTIRMKAGNTSKVAPETASFAATSTTATIRRLRGKE